MTEMLRPADGSSGTAEGLTSASDPELITLVRAGDAAAYEELFLRHRDVAIRYARRISNSERAEDLCAEAFTKILDLLQRGKGPEVAFRAYLLTTVRTSHLNAIRSGAREELVPDHEPISRMVPVIEDPDGRFDRAAVCRAFKELPERWQAALWLTAVEGLPNEEASKHLGIKPNAVASLAFRARAGLRQAYLAQHVLAADDPECRRVLEQLPQYVRDRLNPRRASQIKDHLSRCARCSAAALELTEVDSQLGALLAPLALTGFGLLGGTVIGSGSSPVGLAAGHLKSFGSSLPSILGTKAAAAAAVTVLGVAAGSQLIGHDGGPGTGPAAHRPLPHLIYTKPGNLPITPSPAPAIPGSSPRAAEPTQSAILPPRQPSSQPTAPAAPSPTGTSPSTSPSTPTPSAAPTTAPPVAAKSMAVGTPSDQSYQKSGARWEEVLVPVTNPAKGATLVLTTDRTIQVIRATTSGTGWVCGVPTTKWFDSSSYATTKTVCSYSTSGNGAPLRFDYQVAPNAHLTATLTPPTGVIDTSLLDNLVHVLLRSS